jgi:prevent-host-death family protein
VKFEMTEESINMADAKKHFSELVGRVAYAKERLLITKRGKPMARLVPVEEPEHHLGNVRGWLDDNDPFFNTVERIIDDRNKHVPRVLVESDRK